jgi:hypothetical protein
MATDLFHRCPACELMLPAVEHQRDDRCPSCLMAEGRRVPMDLVTLRATDSDHAAENVSAVDEVSSST